NDLLDLTRLEEGHDLVKEEDFDISGTINELASLLKEDASRKGLSFEVVVHPGFPKFVKGDQSKVRRAVANVAANAIQYTEKGGVRLELIPNYCCAGEQSHDDQGARVDVQIVIQDTGIGMSEAEVDVLFQEFENVEALEYDNMSVTSGSDGTGRPVRPVRKNQPTTPASSPRPEHHVGESYAEVSNSVPSSPNPDKNNRVGRNSSAVSTTSSAPQQRMLGLGLAVVARLVRNMDGQLRLKSEKGSGTKFIIQLPFRLPKGHGAIDLERIMRESGPMTPP